MPSPRDEALQEVLRKVEALARSGGSVVITIGGSEMRVPEGTPAEPEVTRPPVEIRAKDARRALEQLEEGERKRTFGCVGDKHSPRGNRCAWIMLAEGEAPESSIYGGRMQEGGES
jgi:hypothetical protein